MSLRLLVSRHARAGASESEVETTEVESNDAVVASLRRSGNDRRREKGRRRYVFREWARRGFGRVEMVGGR